MSRIKLESESPEELEEEYFSRIREEHEDHYQLRIEDIDYVVNQGDHILDIKYSKSGRATGVSPEPPEFQVLEAEDGDEMEELKRDLEGEEWETDIRPKFREVRIELSDTVSYDEDLYSACVLNKGPWRS